MRSAVALGWVGIGISGFGGTFFTGTSVLAAAEPTWLVVAGSAAGLLGAVLGLLGIVLGDVLPASRWWRLEWLGASLAGAGLAHYALIPWIYLFSGELGRMQQAGATFSLMFGFFLFRILHCWAYGDEIAKRHALLSGKVL